MIRATVKNRNRLPNPIHTIELLDVYEMVKMDKGYPLPAILSLIWAYAGGRSSWGFMLNNVNPYECPWLHWFQVGLSITTHHVISLNPLWVIPAHSFALIEVSCLLLWGDPCISILSLLFSLP